MLIQVSAEESFVVEVVWLDNISLARFLQISRHPRIAACVSYNETNTFLNSLLYIKKSADISFLFTKKKKKTTTRFQQLVDLKIS